MLWVKTVCVHQPVVVSLHLAGEQPQGLGGGGPGLVLCGAAADWLLWTGLYLTSSAARAHPHWYAFYFSLPLLL